MSRRRKNPGHNCPFMQILEFFKDTLGPKYIVNFVQTKNTQLLSSLTPFCLVIFACVVESDFGYYTIYFIRTLKSTIYKVSQAKLGIKLRNFSFLALLLLLLMTKV